MAESKARKSFEVNVGLIGGGDVVESMHLPAITRLPGLKIKWVCDSSLNRARSVAQNWDIGQAFARLDDCNDVDAVLIATPVGTRREILEKTTARGWHALCEKPFAINAHDHREILERAARNGVKLGAGFMRRYYWAVEEARNMVRSKVFGRLLEVLASEPAHLERTGVESSSYRNNTQASGGGVLMETGCHVLDQVMFLSDVERTIVRTCSQTICDDYEIETIAYADMKTVAGAEVGLHLAISGTRPIYQGIALRCESGEIRLQPDPSKGLELFPGRDRLHPLDLPHPRSVDFVQHLLTAFRREWIHFLEAIQMVDESWDSEWETGLLTTDTIAQCVEVAKSSCLGVSK